MARALRSRRVSPLKLGRKILGGPNTLQQENRRSFPRNAVTKRNLAIITDREFGERVGIYRMLEVFESEKIRTSFFPDRYHGAKLSGDL